MKSFKLSNVSKAISVVILIFLVTGVSFAQDGDVERRLSEVENSLLDLQLSQTDQAVVTAFDAMSLDFGGFMTQTFTSNINGDHGSTAAFDRTYVELLLGADLTERDRFFASLAFFRRVWFVNENTAGDVTERDFGSAVETNPAMIAWWMHQFSDEFDVKVGRFVNPWGIINIERFPPVLMNFNRPQFLRPQDDNTIIPAFINGIQAHGKVGMKTDELEYYTYFGSFEDQADDLIFGGRLAYGISEGAFVLGTSYQNGVREAGRRNNVYQDAVSNDGSSEDRYNAFGLDFAVNYGMLGLKAEWVRNMMDSFGDESTYYVQPYLSFNDWIVFYRFDSIDLDEDVDNDPSEQIEHVFGVNYFVSEDIRVRGEYTFNLYELEQDSVGNDRDFDQLQFSATVSF